MFAGVAIPLVGKTGIRLYKMWPIFLKLLGLCSDCPWEELSKTIYGWQGYYYNLIFFNTYLFQLCVLKLYQVS